jgi:spermidine/putrescine-binding protein
MSPSLLTRRALLQRGVVGGALLAASGVLTSCGGPAGRLKFFNWQDYIDPALLDLFRDETGVSVSYSTYASNDELADRLLLAGVPRRGNRKATSFDLIVPSDNLFRRLRTEDRLRVIDRGVVTDALLAAIDPAVASGSPDPQFRHSIPWATGTTGIGYDTTVFSSPPTWEVFADAAQRGRMSLLNERREAFAAALLSLELDPNSVEEREIDAAADQLLRMKPNIRFDSGDYLDALADGTLVAAQAFSTDVLQAQQRNPKLAFTIPEAGGIRWIDLLCVPDDAPNSSDAFAFMAFYLRSDVSAGNAVAVRANTANVGARAALPADVANNPGIFPDGATLGRTVFLADLGDADSLYAAAWERVKSA